MAEPEAEPIPERVPNYDVDEIDNDGMYMNQTPEGEPLFGFASALGAWWPVHCYGLGSVFLLLGLYAVYANVTLMKRGRAGRKSPTKPFLVAINALAATLCLSRSVYLFVDPYNQTELFPKILNTVLFNLAFPCMTSGFAMVLWVLHEVGQMRLSRRSRQRNIRIVIMIITSHFALVILVSIIIDFTMSKLLLVTLCHGFFVVWGLFLCCGFIFLTHRILNLERSSRNTLERIRSRIGDGDAQVRTGGAHPMPYKQYDDPVKSKPADETNIESDDAKLFIDVSLSGGLVDRDSKSDPPPALSSDKKDIKSNGLGPDDESGAVTKGQAELLELNPTLLQSQSETDDLPLSARINPDDRETENNSTALNTNRSNENLTGQVSAERGHAIGRKLSKLARNLQTLGSRCSSDRDVYKISEPSMVTKEKRIASVRSKCSRNDTRPRKLLSRRLSRPSTLGEMSKRAKLTRKVIRIAASTSIASFISCVLNTIFIASFFPGVSILSQSQIGMYIFWTLFRLTEIVMVCTMLYFSAQPMPSGQNRNRSTLRSWFSSLKGTTQPDLLPVSSPSPSPKPGGIPETT